MVPIFREVDVVVVGASTQAVESALTLKGKGFSVLLVSDMSYVGADAAGTLTCAPVNPAQVKRELEERLMRAGVGMLYLVRPVSLMRDFDGRLAGVVLAARTSLLGVRCASVVDHSQHGVVFRLAGGRALERGPEKLRWNVIAKSPLEGAKELAESFGEFKLYQLEFAADGDVLSRMHRARASLVSPEVWLSADLMQEGAPAAFAPVQDVYADAQAVTKRTPGPIALVKDGYGFAPAFLRNPLGMVETSVGALPSLGKVDVVVAGAGTGGAPAGIAASRAGAKTVVLDIQRAMGGVGTLGLITSYWFGNKVGFTQEITERLTALDVESRAQNGARWKPELKTAMYHRMLEESGGTAWMGSYAFGVQVSDGRVTGVLVSTPLGAGVLETKSVVDATGNADIAAAAGVPCRVIGAQHMAVQGTGLSPRLNPGVKGQNSDHTFIDETDPEGITHAFVNARAKFKDAFDNSPMVNSRERRQIVGDLEVSPLDILAQRTFPDTVFTAASNFDTHGFIVHPVFMLATPHKQTMQAHVPFRCMLPKGLEGVLVTGLGMSAHRDALPVLRMQADVQNQGYAAGLACAMAGTGRLRALDIRVLQQKLVDQGVLAPEVLGHTDSFPVSHEAVREAAADLSVPKNVATLFAHPQVSVPLLRADERLDAQIILGLLGEASAGPALAKALAEAEWDKGWNFTGMGQFGASMSRVDVLIIALAKTGYAQAGAVIHEKARQLGDEPEFSHCRALSVAAILAPSLAASLAGLLKKPGMSGHAQLDSWAVAQKANSEMNETLARTVSLRELYLARGLFQAGDVEGLGRTTLEKYAQDLRGHYARHARAVLKGELAEDPA
jgi:ribulose 1,5-bisphosphate synthetase/thiazole synthase